MVSPAADVVVVGNIGVDTNVYLRGTDVDFSVEANFTENLDVVGQAGGYSSRGFARLGYSTAFIGAIGDDASGHWILQTLAADGVDHRGLFIDPAGTSRSVNVMYRDGRRKNFYDGKSHMILEPDVEALSELFAGARLALFHLPNWARRLLPFARAAGVVTASDLQDVVDPNDPYRQDFADAADILFFSAANFPDPAPLIERFLTERPDRVVVCGMGGRGCALGAAGSVRLFPPISLDAPVVDTNGAGDALAAGFLSSYVLEGTTIEEAICRGQIAARYACALRSDSANLITRRELDRLARLLAH